MAFDINKYETEFQQGGQVQTANIANASVTTAKLASGAVTASILGSGAVTTAAIGAASVKGSQLTTGFNFCQIAVAVTGTTAKNVFGAATAPVSGTITAFGIISGGQAGTVVLWGTTAGTVSTLSGSGTGGTLVNSATIVNASVVAGDTVIVTPQAGSQTCFITFVTAN